MLSKDQPAARRDVLQLFRCFAVVTVLATVSGCDQGGGATTAQSPAIETKPLAFLSFKSLYELNLKRADEATGITAYEGLLSMHWEDACTGYTADQRIGALIWNQEGGEIVSNFHTTSWEARDQTQFRFRSTSRFNDRIVEQVVGEANRKQSGAEGIIKYQEPETKEVSMSGDVLFPSEYLAQVIQAAIDGKTGFRALMADGSSETEIFDAVSFIGPPKQLDESELEFNGAELLRGKTYWTVQMGYHDPKSKDSVADVTVGMRLFENGVATDLDLDYGDLVLSGKLRDLQEIEGAGC